MSATALQASPPQAAPTSPVIQELALSAMQAQRIASMVEGVLSECPGQVEPRYLNRIEALSKDFLADIPALLWSRKRPFVVTGLPVFDNIEKSKILALLLGETIGKCAAYSEYNQSYITDIRPTKFSKELSSGTELLDMHNDLTFATDKCRPRALVLVAHIASGDVPKTLLAPADLILAELTPEDAQVLAEPVYEIRSGSKLRWPSEQVRRISIIERENEHVLIRLSFTNISARAGLPHDSAAKAMSALSRLAETALELGRHYGHVIRRGEALFIPNDYCLHGRDAYESDNYERLLLRSYVVTPDVVKANHGNTMISLRT
ncbi:MAG: TauD/TfdA family dioxygenase [Hyphomicrobiales bacterium]|nr:TauD/TfdA family dioxygenase [Hyphomicrobiales bacterium]MBV8824266.1 TauD/TfdA family dioxygenase [Hyphomicrobiales bacterium]MBV9428578.1 TauD/TfdA family dioxygenase [Bradyrhizobiaceae bacterium]